MLQSIRERAQGWIAWAIVILIAIPFALWGIQSYFGGGGEIVVATVNGQDIPRRELDRQYQNARIMLREQLGASYDPSLFDDVDLRRQVLDSMIREQVLLSRSDQMGLRASDDEIRIAIMSNPAFQSGGRFDKEAYERALAIQGLTPALYERRLRQQLVGSQLERVVLSSGLVTDGELSVALQLMEQQREIQYLRVRASDLDSEEPFSDEEIEREYEEDQGRFEIPEQVRMEYLLLNEETISAAAPPPGEAELRRLYESQPERFGTPERRVARHILAAVPTSADQAADEAARQAILSAAERIASGEAFEAVAKDVSDDVESAAKGGLIGEIEMGMMDQSFEKVAFSLPSGGVSEAVRTPFGYHLIRIDEVIPADVRPFEEVRSELAVDARKESVESLYYDWAERLATMTYEAADTLAPAAEALGLDVQRTDWAPRTGGEGLFGNPKILLAAFSDEVARQGLNSELIEPERGVLEAVVLRVVDHRDATVRPLSEVRDELVARMRARRSQDAAEQRAEELTERLEGGASLEDVAGDWTISDVHTIGRDQADVPDAVRALAFEMPRPDGGRPTFGQVRLVDGDVAVVAVHRVIDASESDLSADARAREREALSRATARRYVEGMLADMVSRAKIERNLDLTSSESEY